MPYGTVNADLMTTSDGISSAGLYGFKNRIINGDMRIDQRNAGASVTPTNGQYITDRFGAGLTQASKYSEQQNAGSVTPPAGFTNYLGVTSLSAYSVLSTDAFWIYQAIEGFNFSDFGFGTASAQSVTLSFWVRSSLTGTFGGSLQNYARTRSYPFSYTISAANTWEQKSVTIAGDTSGTWVGASSAGAAYLNFGLGIGSITVGTAGAWAGADYRSATGATSVVGTNGATFYVTGVQLERGSIATSFDYLDYGRSLMQCQRYYEKSFEIGTAPAQNVGSYNGASVASSPGQLSGMSFGDTRFKINKRTAPTITFYNPAAANAFARDQNAGVNCSATSAWMAGESSFAITANTGSGSTATNRIGVHWSADSEL